MTDKTEAIDMTQAISSLDVCPDLVNVHVYGYHWSTVKNNKRHWYFETMRDRDNFVSVANQNGFRREGNN